MQQLSTERPVQLVACVFEAEQKEGREQEEEEEEEEKECCFFGAKSRGGGFDGHLYLSPNLSAVFVPLSTCLPPRWLGGSSAMTKGHTDEENCAGGFPTKQGLVCQLDRQCVSFLFITFATFSNMVLNKSNITNEKKSQ